MEGCLSGKHSGVVLNEQVLLCLNYGEIGPEKTYPDSFCGAPFSPKNPAGCNIHTGYLNKAEIWSCCGSNDVK